MTASPLQRLRDLALEDAALRLALTGATQVADLLAIARQRGITLSDADARQWFATEGQATAALSSEELDAISEGLSVSDEELDSIAGGQSRGEAIC